MTLRATPPEAVTAEEYWPDMDGLDHRDTVTDFTLPAGTFFDCAPIHLLTTATLARLQKLYPPGRFEVRRFRPNLVVQLASESQPLRMVDLASAQFFGALWEGHG